MLLEVELFDDVEVVLEAPVVSFCSPSSEQAKRIRINKVTINSKIILLVYAQVLAITLF